MQTEVQGEVEPEVGEDGVEVVKESQRRRFKDEAVVDEVLRLDSATPPFLRRTPRCR